LIVQYKNTIFFEALKIKNNLQTQRTIISIFIYPIYSGWNCRALFSRNNHNRLFSEPDIQNYIHKNFTKVIENDIKSKIGSLPEIFESSFGMLKFAEYLEVYRFITTIVNDGLPGFQQNKFHVQLNNL